jgi:hypothetical protein
MTDPAPLGGTGNDPVVIPLGADGQMCPGEAPYYHEGPTISGLAAPEGPHDVTITATGIESQVVVTYADDASVKPPSISPACVDPMDGQGSDYCPGSDGMGIVRAKVTGAAETKGDIDLIYGITQTDGSSIKFKVNNPHEADVDVYVKYHKPTVTAGGGWSEACDKEGVPGCGAMGGEIEADCLYAEGHPFSLVQVYFVDKSADGAIKAITGGAEIDECCVENGGATPPPAVTAQYSFLLACECPPSGSSSRALRGNDFEFDLNKILALFEEQ